jgi:mRNA interferase RelE/StbE
MKSYEIEISGTAERQLRRLPPPDQLRVARAIVALGREPLPRGVRKLTGYEDVYRVRVGRYRVLYSIEEGRLVVIILKVGHRKEVYR